jgi:cysteinyl-tRNA synthetase
VLHLPFGSWLARLCLVLVSFLLKVRLAYSSLVSPAFGTIGSFGYVYGTCRAVVDFMIYSFHYDLVNLVNLYSHMSSLTESIDGLVGVTTSLLANQCTYGVAKRFVKFTTTSFYKRDEF